jgi:hypothetical protein
VRNEQEAGRIIFLGVFAHRYQATGHSNHSGLSPDMENSTSKDEEY